VHHIHWLELATLYRQKHVQERLKESSTNYQPRNLGIPVIPDHLTLRKYQHQAVANWLENKGRGTLKMATGSGKTIIALAITQELYQQIGLQVLLIVSGQENAKNLISSRLSP
jgi:superfamily II DNA or RNA helicase